MCGRASAIASPLSVQVAMAIARIFFVGQRLDLIGEIAHLGRKARAGNTAVDRRADKRPEQHPAHFFGVRGGRRIELYAHVVAYGRECDRDHNYPPAHSMRLTDSKATHARLTGFAIGKPRPTAPLVFLKIFAETFSPPLTNSGASPERYSDITTKAEHVIRPPGGFR